MTDNNMSTPRVSREERDPEQSATRAIVANASAVWTFLVGLVTVGVFLVGIGWKVSQALAEIQRMQDAQAAASTALAVRVTTIENTMSARGVARDKQFDAIDSRIEGLEERVRPLETTAASTASSLAFIRDQITNGFDEIGKRLDRIETGATRR